MDVDVEGSKPFSHPLPPLDGEVLYMCCCPIEGCYGFETRIVLPRISYPKSPQFEETFLFICTFVPLVASDLMASPFIIL